MYRFLIIFHIITSSAFLILAFAVTSRSIIRWIKHLKYSKTDKYMSYLFMALLYLTLVHGIIMYFFIDPASKTATDIQNAIKQASLRFWVIEHFYFMTFALILSQIGSIFIHKSSSDHNRFIYSSFYYGMATLITLISVVAYFINK